MSLTFNKLKDTVVYGSFRNTNLGALDALSTFDGTVFIGGQLLLSGNITANETTITPIELSYLNDASSNIQEQINSVKTDISSNILDISNNYVHQNKIIVDSSLNQINSTIIHGSLEVNDVSLNTIKLNGNITANGLIISPTELSYLNDASSNIQSQINLVKQDLSSNIQDISNNYVKQNKINTVSTFNQVSSTIVYGSF